MLRELALRGDSTDTGGQMGCLLKYAGIYQPCCRSAARTCRASSATSMQTLYVSFYACCSVGVAVAEDMTNWFKVYMARSTYDGL